MLRSNVMLQTHSDYKTFCTKVTGKQIAWVWLVQTVILVAQTHGQYGHASWLYQRDSLAKSHPNLGWSDWALAWAMDPVKLSQVMGVSVGHLCRLSSGPNQWYPPRAPIPAWLGFGSANPCSHRAIHPHNLRKIWCLAGMGLAVNTIVNTRITALDLYCIHIVHLTGVDRTKVSCQQRRGI